MQDNKNNKGDSPQKLCCSEQELRMKQPKHKRLEYVAGWNIHQLVKGKNQKAVARVGRWLSQFSNLGYDGRALT